MRPWWLVALVACSDERQQRKPLKIEHSRRSIDVTVTGAPISIRGVELARGRDIGALELGYRVEANDTTINVPARITCRVGGHNVVYPSSGAGKVAGPRLTSVFRSDPFVEEPQVCEVGFYVADRRVASACYRGGEIKDGACAVGTFAPPARRTQYSIELAQPALELHDGSAVISALYTVLDPLPSNRQLAGQIRCEDAKGVATGEGDFAFVPLDQLTPGTSVYGPLAIFLDRTPTHDATCELRIVSRATTGGAPTEQVHARYCLTVGAVQAGGCG